MNFHGYVLNLAFRFSLNLQNIGDRGAEGEGVILTKNLFSRERVNPYFLVTFDIIKSHTCPESFI